MNAEFMSWTSVEVDGKQHLATLGRDTEGKFIAVVYRHAMQPDDARPEQDGLYVRGESYESIDVALDEAKSLLTAEPSHEVGKGAGRE